MQQVNILMGHRLAAGNMHDGQAAAQAPCTSAADTHRAYFLHRATGANAWGVLMPDVLVVTHTVRCVSHSVGAPPFAAASAPANQEQKLDTPVSHRNVRCRMEEGARGDADADGHVRFPRESESKRKGANECDNTLGQRGHVCRASCSRTMMCKDGLDHHHVEMTGAEREAEREWPMKSGTEARKRKRDQARTHVDKCIDKCFDCKAGEFARRKNSPKQCRSMPGGPVKGAMGHTACNWQDDARAETLRLENEVPAQKAGRASCFRCKKVRCSRACPGFGARRRYLGHGSESDYTMSNREDNAHAKVLHKVLTPSTANKGSTACRQHQVPSEHERVWDFVTDLRKMTPTRQFGVQECTPVGQSLDKGYECQVGELIGRENSPKPCRSMAHSGAKGAMWQDDARMKAHHTDSVKCASIYFEEDDGGVFQDEPEMMMQDEPGGSARACAQQQISSAAEMRQVSEPVRRRRLASWVPRLRHGPAALAATPLPSTPSEAKDGHGSPEAGRNAVRHHAVNHGSDDGRVANFWGNAGRLDPVAETNTLVRPRPLAALGEAQGMDCDHQSWRRRCGECKGAMMCYFGIDECRCREHGKETFPPA